MLPARRPGHIRIICVSDTLNDVEIPPADIIIHIGGYGDDIRWFNNLPHKYKILIMNEHDEPPPKWMDIMVLNSLRGATTIVNGIRINAATFVQTTPIFEEKIFEEKIFNERVFEEKVLKECIVVCPITEWDIVISAVPPLGIHDLNVLGSHIGSSELLEYMEQYPPRACIFGGAPASVGVSTRNSTLFANATQQNGGLPIILDVKPKNNDMNNGDNEGDGGD